MSIKKAAATLRKAKTPAAPPTPKKPRTVNVRVATDHVHKNLIRYWRTENTSEFYKFPLDDVESFTKDVKSFLMQASKLATSTLDHADYEELLAKAREVENWKPKRARKAAPKTAPASVTATKTVIKTVIAPTPTLRRKAAQTSEEPPSKVNRVVPGNWRYMAENAMGNDGPDGKNTLAARKWWTEYCAKRMRGEV